MMTMNAEKAHNGEMTRDQFNNRVAAELEDRGRDDVADMSRRYDSDAHSMSAATVAGEEGLELVEAAVDEVADARVDWYDEAVALQVEEDEDQ